MNTCGARHRDVSHGVDRYCTLPAGHRPANKHEQEVETSPGNCHVYWWEVWPGEICATAGCGNAARPNGYCKDCLPGPPFAWRLRRILRRATKALLALRSKNRTRSRG